VITKLKETLKVSFEIQLPLSLFPPIDLTVERILLIRLERRGYHHEGHLVP
jgi:hypothetical protein